MLFHWSNQVGRLLIDILRQLQSRIALIDLNVCHVVVDAAFAAEAHTFPRHHLDVCCSDSIRA